MSAYGEANLQRSEKREDEGDDSEVKQKLWTDVLSKSILSAVFHPIDHVKTLIQLGYEPTEPVPSTTFLGRPVLKLPSVFSYMGYIRSLHGTPGLYKGAGAHVGGCIVYSTVYFYVSVRMPRIPTFEEDQMYATDEEKIYNFFLRQSQETLARVTATLAFHPLRLIGIRMMAQLIGGEKKYTSIIGSVREIVHDEGFLALWNGVTPALAGEIICLWTAGSVSFMINNYLVDDPSVRRYISATTNFIVNSLVYPFLLVGTMMSVSGAPIAAGGPPHMAPYKGWVQCLTHLSKMKLLRRGASLFWRYHPHTKVSPEGFVYKMPVDICSLD